MATALNGQGRSVPSVEHFQRDRVWLSAGQSPLPKLLVSLCYPQLDSRG